jgi:hypothetical protein
VNPFLEDCRREWKRLGVPDPVANEMAADLAADLAEAEAEGASPEEVLGNAVFDARSFAAVWAAERGVTQEPAPSKHRTLKSVLPFAVTACAFIAVVGLLLVLSSSGPGRVRLALPAPVGPALWVSPPRLRIAVSRLGAGTPRLRIVTPSPPVSEVLPRPGAQVFRIEAGASELDTRRLGFLLLIIGVAGTVALALVWVGAGRARRGRTGTEGGPSAPAY